MQSTSATNQLPRSLPEQQGIPSSAIAAFLDTITANNLELHSFMLLRHSHVVAEGWWAPYKPELPHMLFSLSKSFTSTAIGFAVSENLLALKDKVVSFFPDDTPAVISPLLAQMNVSHLLMMGTGHVEDTTMYMHQNKDGNWVKAFLELPVEKTPGTHFLYNTGATYILSAILQKVSGLTLLEYLQPRLFDPLGIHHPTWESCPRGINTGGYGLSVTTEDILKFGQLYLQEGLWNHKQLLPKEWISRATSKQISNGEGDNEWSQGYGYQFWRCRHDAYRGDGAFGQFCIVMPDQDAVVAITSGINDMQSVMNAVWDHLLPAMKPEPLAPDSASATAVNIRLSNLELLPPRMIPSSVHEESLNNKVYRLDNNELALDSFSISFEPSGAVLTLGGVRGSQRVTLGRQEWAASRVSFLDAAETQVMSSFTWNNENVLQLTLRLIETPYCFTLDVTMEEDAIVITQHINVSFGEKKPETILGHLQ